MTTPIKLEVLLKDLQQKNNIKSVEVKSDNNVNSLIKDYINILCNLEVDNPTKDCIYIDNERLFNIIEDYGYRFIIVNIGESSYKIITNDDINYPTNFISRA